MMGPAGVGKTSMRSIIFANCAPKDTLSMGFTYDVSESKINFMGKLNLNLFDCGGQSVFTLGYFDQKKKYVFENVEQLVFVIEAERSKDNNDTDLEYYEKCITALDENSPNAKVFVLIHKMDLINEDRKKQVRERREAEIKKRSKNFEVVCFSTSIWDVSLYRAWTEIVSSMITDKAALSSSLKKLAEACGATEIILFEKATFLLTSHFTVENERDDARFEKISHIIKKFKLSCNNNNADFVSMFIKSSSFLNYLTDITHNMFIMIIVKNEQVNYELLKMNVQMAKDSFEQMINN